MQKLYFFSAVLAALFFGTLSADAQRSVNIQAKLLNPATGSTVTVGTPFSYRVEFKNLGPDTLKPTDTLYYTFSGSSNTYGKTGMTRKVGDTVLWSTTLTLNSSSSSSLRLCAYSLLSGPGVIDPNRANDSSCVTLTVKAATGIKTVFVEGSDPVTQQLNVFPNPASSDIALDYTSVNNTPVTARVMDLAGRTVMTYDFGDSYVGKQGFKLDVSALRHGMYFVELRQDNIRAVGKINKF